MKNYIITNANKLILVALALLGFSCDPDDLVVEYGMPSADFKAHGTIVDEVTLQKLSNIEVVMEADTVYSDENGNYEIKVTNLPSSQTYTVKFADIDGARNGTYLATDSIIDFSDEDFVNGDGSWYSGEKSKEINIKLSPDETL